MGFYRNRILPRLIHCAMRQDDLKAYRGRVVAAAAGRVLEVGIGSGLNMPFYGGGVTEVIGLDPSAQLLAMAQRAIRPKLPIELIEGSAEAIPLETASVDAVLTTRRGAGFARDAARAEDRRRAAVRGARTRPGDGRALVAGSLDPDLETAGGRMSPQPPDRRFDRIGRLSRRAAGEQLCAGSQALDLYV